VNENGLFIHPKVSKVSKMHDNEGKDLKQLYLMYHNNNHYDCVNSIIGLLGTSYFCESCRTCYTVKGSHKCVHAAVLCGLCQREGLCHKNTNEELKIIQCADCNNKYYRQSCYDEHKANKMCEKRYKCLIEI
jgi:hypothetical protein